MQKEVLMRFGEANKLFIAHPRGSFATSQTETTRTRRNETAAGICLWMQRGSNDGYSMLLLRLNCLETTVDERES
jgi:hypothetical protein